MEQKSSLAEVLSTLGGNPLPDAYILALSNINAQQVEDLSSQLKNYRMSMSYKLIRRGSNGFLHCCILQRFVSYF